MRISNPNKQIMRTTFEPHSIASALNRNDMNLYFASIAIVFVINLALNHQIKAGECSNCALCELISHQVVDRCA